MQYSLSSRFQGALIGAALGEILGYHCAARQAAGLPLNWSAVQLWGWTEIQPDKLSWRGGEGAIAALQQMLTHNGTFPQIWLENGTGAKYWSVRAIATLPWMLFTYEKSTTLFQSGMLNGNPEAIAQPSALEEDYLKLVALAIAWSCQECPQPTQWLSQWSQQFGNNIAPSIASVLQTFQHLLTTASPITLVESSLKTLIPSLMDGISGQSPLDESHYREQSQWIQAIAIALYSFFSTPEDFALSLLRSVRYSLNPQLSGALVGAMSGTYNSLGGIPLNWWMQFQRSPQAHQALKTLWEMSYPYELQHRADQLLALWSGIAFPTLSHLPKVAIAAPGVVSAIHQ